MPPTGYLSTPAVEACVQYLANTYPSICQAIILPEATNEGRISRALKIGKGQHNNAVLFLGGVHARELVNPDLLVSFALNLCRAYTNNTGLTFGGKSYTNVTIKLIVEALDVVIFPQVNPDGRTFVLSPQGDVMWRKNRSFNANSCRGVDLNRNYDILWSSGIGTSANPCEYQIYKGPAAFSEPETRNVRWLVDNNPNIVGMIDVHSYSNDLLYPWGDDNNQTTDAAMNFTNPAYNGLRGTLNDTVYKEYIPQADLDWYTTTGKRVVDAINAVRGEGYVSIQSINLYPTSATSDDYCYSRHFVDTTKRKIYGLTLETGRFTGNSLESFQPLYSEVLNIIAEASAGLIEFCLASMCVVAETTRGTRLEKELVAMHVFREEMIATVAGQKYVRLLEEHTQELLEIILFNELLHEETVHVVEKVYHVVQSRTTATPKVFDTQVTEAVEELIQKVSQHASPSLHKALHIVRHDLTHFRNKTVTEGLEATS